MTSTTIIENDFCATAVERGVGCATQLHATSDRPLMISLTEIIRYLSDLRLRKVPERPGSAKSFTLLEHIDRRLFRTAVPPQVMKSSVYKSEDLEDHESVVRIRRATIALSAFLSFLLTLRNSLGNKLFAILWSTSSVFDQYLDMHDLDPSEWVGAYKYFHIWPLYRFMKHNPTTRHLNNPPPKPSHFTEADATRFSQIGSGEIWRFFKVRLATQGFKNYSLFFNLSNSVKRGCESMTDNDIWKSMVGQSKRLSRRETQNVEADLLTSYRNPRGEPCLYVRGRLRVPQNISQALKPYINAIWRDCLVGEPTLGSLTEPSPKSCYENKLSEGGANGYIRAKLVEKELLVYEIHHMNMDGDGNMTPEWALIPKFSTHPGGQDSLWDLCSKSDAEENYYHVTVSAVLEPLKCRLVSKGEAIAYYLTKVYQKHMHGCIKNLPQFSLTGRTLHDSHDPSLEWLERFASPKVPYRVSGDYSAATDNLKMSVTKMCFECYLNLLPPNEIRSRECDPVMRRCIYEQKIHYKPSGGLNFEEFGGKPTEIVITQTWGQLMGSPLSFPLLCVANMAAFWYSMDLMQDTQEAFPMITRARDVPVLVNGDDIYFFSNDTHYGIWKRVVEAIGMELSPGKNFVNPNFFTINTRPLYADADGQIRSGKLYQTGLLMGKRKVDNTDQDYLESPMHDVLNYILEGSKDPQSTVDLFYILWEERIMLASIPPRGDKPTINPWVPRHYGGLGLRQPTTPPPFWSYTNGEPMPWIRCRDRKIARMYDNSFYRTTRGGCPQCDSPPLLGQVPVDPEKLRYHCCEVAVLAYFPEFAVPEREWVRVEKKDDKTQYPVLGSSSDYERLEAPLQKEMRSVYSFFKGKFEGAMKVNERSEEEVVSWLINTRQPVEKSQAGMEILLSMLGEEMEFYEPRVYCGVKSLQMKHRYQLPHRFDSEWKKCKNEPTDFPNWTLYRKRTLEELEKMEEESGRDSEEISGTDQSDLPQDESDYRIEDSPMENWWEDMYM